MIRRFLAVVSLAALLCASALATTTVSGTIRELSTGTATNAFVRFWLRGCNGNQPRVSGSASIAPHSNGEFYFDFQANSAGVVSGTLYSTRDAAGTGNGDIECGGSHTSAYYGMQTYRNGVPGPELRVHAKSGATLDPSNVTPFSTIPVSTAGTGDTTYLRLDGGNSPITGPVTFQGGNSFTASNTFSASNNFSASNTFSGNNTLSGANLLTAKKLNSTRFADQFPGADPAAKIAAAIADLPATGGTVDATGLEGAQTFAAGVTYPSDRPVMIKLGHATISGPCPLFDGTSAADGSALIGTSTGDWSLNGSHYGSRLICTSGTDAIKFGAGSPRISGIRVENLAINCGSIAARGLTIDTVQNSAFRNLEIANCTAVSYSNKVSNGAANANVQFNSYEKLTSVGSPICLQADNNAGKTSDWTHNRVTEFLCNYTGTAGILLNGADNNWFYATRAARVSGTGPGVLLVQPAGANFGALNNYFYGLIGGVTSVTALQAQTGTYGNTVYGYDFVNGEAAPSLLGTAELIVEGSVRCGPSGCAGASGTHPTPWIFAQGNAGNSPTSNPAPLIEGCAWAWNWSNGGGEGDLACNLGGGNASNGLLKLWKWDGAAKTARAVFPDSDIGRVVGTNPDGPDRKHKKTTGCTTGATAGNLCLTTVTWTTPFADANYSVSCTLENTTQLGHLGNTGPIAAESFQINTVTDSNNAISGTVDCSAIHD